MASHGSADSSLNRPPTTPPSPATPGMATSHFARAMRTPSAGPGGAYGPGGGRGSDGEVYLTAADFLPLKTIGEGCMGKVVLARLKSNGQLYAIKVIRKEAAILQQEQERTKGERDILVALAAQAQARTTSQFLVKLHCAFQDAQDLFLVLDYCPGGDLANQLALHTFLPPAAVAFYAAEIVLGLEELHRMGVLYRDLKPENILIDAEGHVVLTDFGLSKMFPSHVSPYTRSFCGTPDYLAPEVLRGEPYSYAVDWWSLGAIIYEMLTGSPPFYHDNHQELYRRVLEEPVQFPASVSDVARSLVSQLMDKNPNTRLGARLNGAADIRGHPFFASIRWDDARARKLVPPFRPRLVADDDVSHFEDTYTTLPPKLASSPPQSRPLPEALDAVFAGFSFGKQPSTPTHPPIVEQTMRRLSRTQPSLSIIPKLGRPVGSPGSSPIAMDSGSRRHRRPEVDAAGSPTVSSYDSADSFDITTFRHNVLHSADFLSPVSPQPPLRSLAPGSPLIAAPRMWSGSATTATSSGRSSASAISPDRIREPFSELKIQDNGPHPLEDADEMPFLPHDSPTHA